VQKAFLGSSAKLSLIIMDVKISSGTRKSRKADQHQVGRIKMLRTRELCCTCFCFVHYYNWKFETLFFCWGWDCS